MNILVTLNSNYLNVLVVMLKSLAYSNKHQKFDVYVMNESLTEKDIEYLKENTMKNINIIDLKIYDKELEKAPVTKRYPKEMYYRIFASYYLPKKVKKILYLDPDLVVINKIDKLYNTNLDNYYFAAASHIWGILQAFNKIRLRMNSNNVYINSGVMLMNIKLLREKQNRDDVYRFINKNKNKLMLPDQDVISGLYGNKILPLDPYAYNMTEKLLNQKYFLPHISERWIKENSVIIHYCGKNKPWNKSYKGSLNKFYNFYEKIEINKQDGIKEKFYKKINLKNTSK